MRIAKHKVVSIGYRLTNPQGQVLDESGPGSPLAYLHGTQSIIPGLERALEGKTVGDKFEVDIAAADAYGEKDLTLIQDVPRSAFGQAGELSLGMQFQARSPAGTRVVTIVELGSDTVKVDANHPLAGMPLHFAIDVVEVREATKDEISHGHVHGPGGHHHH
jgi:FKBP-type peptidyl-prolyl cis-trans isomerase SlyD